MIRSITILSLLLFSLPKAWSQPQVVAAVNSASFQSSLPAGGALATAFVTGLTALTRGTYVASLSQALPHSLGGVTVTMNNDYAPLLAVIVPSDPTASVQINFQVPLSANASMLYPYAKAGAAYSGNLTVSDGVNNAVLSTSSTTSQVPMFGGFFSVNGYAAALHASDLSLVTPQKPAQPGESIIVYADGFFLTWPRPPVGIPAPQLDFQPDYTLVPNPGSLFLQAYPIANPTCAPNPGSCMNNYGSVASTPSLTINSMGLVAGTVGVEGINFIVPANQKGGYWALFFNCGSCPDGSGIPGTCGASYGYSSPYVLLPVSPL
jgi:uncharacterized protein (TIGR03437 family)